MNPLYNFEDIDDYVQGRMSDSDRSAFEAAMAADPQLATQVEALRAETTVLRSLRREGLLEKLAEWENEAPAQQKVVRLWYRRWPLAAAAAVVAMLLVWMLWPGFQTKPTIPGIADRSGLPDSSTNTMTPETLKDTLPDIVAENQGKSTLPTQKQPATETRYAEMAISNFNADYTSINLMGTPDTQSDQNPLQLAAEAIEQKQYTTALAHLRKIPAGNTDDYTAAQIMAGDVYFLQKKFALAGKAYAEPAKSQKDKFRDVAQWHLLLAYLAMYPDKSADFERVMTAILNEPDHPYLESAKRIQREMNQE